MHLNTEVVLDFIEGRLDKDRQAFWMQHMELCTDCAADVRRWQELRTGLKRSHLLSASEQELDNAVHIFPPRTEHGGSKIRSVLAAIVFDSILQPAMAGVRGNSIPAARQLVMRAEEFDIHVRIWGAPGRRQMLGQLLPRDGKYFVSSARFHLLHNGERVESTATDETGEFSFTDVPEGELSLQVDLPNLTVIGALNVQDSH